MEILSDTRRMADRGGCQGREVVGIVVSLPAAVGLGCVASRTDLSTISLAIVSILFLVCLVSAFGGILISFWMRSAVLAWWVRIVGAGWLGTCLWAVGQFVVQTSGFSH